MEFTVSRPLNENSCDATSFCPPIAAVKVVIFFVARSYTPLKFLPQPIGQLTGQVRMPSTLSISSIKLKRIVAPRGPSC